MVQCLLSGALVPLSWGWRSSGIDGCPKGTAAVGCLRNHGNWGTEGYGDCGDHGVSGGDAGPRDCNYHLVADAISDHGGARVTVVW